MNKLDVQNAILNAMTPYLDDDQLYQLKNTLIEQLYGMNIVEEETRLSVGKRTKICVKKNENLCQKFCAATDSMEERIMDKVTIVFWSQSGNTESMANAVAEGVTAAGKEAVVVDVASASLDDLKAAKGFAMGCPAMGAEVLEEGEMEPFVCDVEGFAAGKTIALFGSYGWGDGQWMRDWVDRMTAAGATVVNGEGVICQEAPDDAALDACKDLGKQLAAL